MRITIRGVVQGVGFRPTVYRIANELNLNGYVMNKGSEVEICIDKLKGEFLNRLKKELPPIARIAEVEVEEDSRRFEGFKILRSEQGARRSTIPAEESICDKCLEELFHRKNKRYLYPFTNCTSCGARFSLIRDVPYDREHTAMDVFKLCSNCRKEYKNPKNRRFHAQTTSCPKCGPRYRLYDKKETPLEGNAIKNFAALVNKGAIGVVKSWGGMHLCCNLEKVKRFRKWYRRAQKPFAVMVRDLDTAKKYANISEEEKKLLLSSERPIVLANKKLGELASPGLPTIGIYLPYTGLHYLLFHYLDHDALIMTSANIPGEPMLLSNHKVFSLGADYYLLHNRQIVNRIDDSVVKLWHGKRFFIRKSRGYVPCELKIPYSKSVLSVGAERDVCGAISNRKYLYTTQYIGNTRYYTTLEFLRESLLHMMKLLGVEKVDAVGVDHHPTYSTRKVAEKFAAEYQAQLIEVQHHWAHAASLLIDNKIEELVALTLDGLGYGTDGTLWGGEVLYANFKSFERLGHLQNIPLLGGDQATRDPRRLVFGIWKQWGEEVYFRGKEALVLTKLIPKALRTSSLGRVLDALSCCLGICEYRAYEGEPAMKLERYLENGKPRYNFDAEIKGGVVFTVELFKQLNHLAKPPISERRKADLAYSFVKALLRKLTEIAIEYAIDNSVKGIGITGGVSYNLPITELVANEVKNAGLKFFTHQKVPNGDGGIAVGQNAVAGYKSLG